MSKKKFLSAAKGGFGFVRHLSYWSAFSPRRH